MTARPNFLEPALAYARRNIATFPLAPRSKVPLFSKTAGGRGVLDASTDLAVVTRWWTNRPDANIAIACGAASGFFVLDIDPRHCGDDTLAELERQHGPLPETTISHTGGGGEHLLWRFVHGVLNSAGYRLGPGLDIRSQGGYIVAPPSIHENGRAYAWDIDRGIDDMPPAEAPEWLIALACGPLRSEGSGTSSKAELPENWRRLVAEGVAKGSRNIAVTRLAGHLLRHYVDPYVALDICRTWNAHRCRPPLDDAEVVKIVDSIAAREAKRRGAAA